MKKDTKTSLSEDEAESEIPNDNGKRPADSPEKDGKKRLRTKSLYRQPTVKELNRLQETENLFNSNLFRLQVDEVIQEVKVKEKTEQKIQKWFADLKTHLLSIPEDDTEYDLTEQTLAKTLKVKLPISDKLRKTKCVFKFHKFRNIEIVGSYSLGCSINSKLRVDIQITVPAETYTKNDSINYRYHKKHAAYLAYIASNLNKLESIDELHYTWLNGSETKPVIDLRPAGKLSNHFIVRINLACEPEAYKLHRFSPSRNNLRESWLFDNGTENPNEIGPPTPYYNSGVLSDLTVTANQEFLNGKLLDSDNLKQAIVLLKIWLRQRKLQVSGYVVSLFVAYLVQLKRINNIMSSYQIVRNVWISLKSSEWDTKGITLHKETNSPLIEEFLQHFPVVFLDVTGYYNLCYDMGKGTYSALRRESALAVDMLDNGSINSFTPLFMTPVQPLLQFDHILRFKNLPQLKEAIIMRAPKTSRVNYGLDQLALVTDSLHALLVKGLGNRVDLILQMIDADFSWSVKKRPEKVKKDGHEEKLSFGFILNSENAFNAVEKGPPANLPEAEEFRAFWGDKSELRRFQDGSITETCVWEGDSNVGRRTIPRQIIEYLLKLKYDIPASQLYHVQGQLDPLLGRKRPCCDEAHMEEASLRALNAFDELRRDLRALTQLPLDISAVYGVSPVFSFSDPLPPLSSAPPERPWRRGNCALLKHGVHEDGALAFPEYTPVCKAIVELGHSGKWPGNIEAFRCLKAAFHIQIADRLQKQYELPTQAHPTHVDLLKNGLVFRLEIAHPKEITLLRREMVNGVVKYKETEESVRLQKETVLLPRLRGALHGLQQKYPALGPTTCLLQRWASAHLLTPHVPSELCSLLAASVFLSGEPLAAPSQPLAGFLRALARLAHTDWDTETLVIDFNGDMKREEIAELERKFSADLDRDLPSMRIVTSHDGASPSVWTRESPSLAARACAQALAKGTLAYMETALLADMEDNVLGAFVPSLSSYDFLIHLHPHLVPYASETVDKRPQSRPLAETLSEDIIPVVEFHPVMKYLDELRSAYSDYALFFHDSYGGDVIAVTWVPSITESQPELQILNANALHPVEINGGVHYRVNTAALIEDFRILGEGLVKDITVNNACS